MPFSCMKSHALCVMTPDDDVEGHVLVPLNTATFTMTWFTDENGEPQYRFVSDDPEAEKVLFAFLTQTPPTPAEPANT